MNAIYVLFLISMGWMCVGFIVVLNEKVKHEWTKPLYLQEWVVFCFLWIFVLLDDDFKSKLN